MKALLVSRLPKGPGWMYELKFDGVRALAIKNGGHVSLISRAKHDLSAKYSELLPALRKLRVQQAVLDGEIVALDREGRPSFQALQSYQTATTKPPLRYYVFDLLHLQNRDLTGLRLWQRKQRAQKLVSKLGPLIHFSTSFEIDPERLARETQARGLEGLVAKQKESRYEPGRRSGAWVKFKWSNEQEFVIGGYSKPKGRRTHFGAILVGYCQEGKLMFAAKVGTGFDDKNLASLYRKFQDLVRPDCPFANLPEQLPASAKGLTGSEMKHCTWLEPKLVCQVRFSEWTRDLHLRQPAFLGLPPCRRVDAAVVAALPHPTPRENTGSLGRGLAIRKNPLRVSSLRIFAPRFWGKYPMAPTSRWPYGKSRCKRLFHHVRICR